ncbi:MAG: alpha/beta hydrolase [Hyphomicrobiales bacterium]|nr:MAG: alpha/beta hydrolase [Hyphomicrobiales bacterium]
MSAAGQTRFTGTAGNQLVADIHGEGAPVLLLHGGGQTRHAWGGAARSLAGRGWRTYSLDQRGHGDSDWVASGAYHFADYAGDLCAVAGAVRDELGMAPVVIGASLGGLAAMLAQHEAPDLVRALILVDVTPRMEAQGVDRILSFMGENMGDGFASMEEAAEAVAAYLPHRTRPVNPVGLAKNLRRSPDGRLRWHWDPAFLTAQSAAMQDYRETEQSLVNAARTISCPALLVRGAMSDLVSPELAEEFLNMVPHAEFADVRNAGHMVAGDENDVFIDALEGFMSRL